MTKSFDFKNAAENLKRIYGDELAEKITIYTICSHVSKSGMSRDIKCLVIKNGHPVNLGFGRVKGYGMDIGFHAAYTIFCIAYEFGQERKYPYQEFLNHQWL